MIRKIVLFSILTFSIQIVFLFAKEVSIEDENIKVTFNKDNASFTIFDKMCG